MRQEGVGEWWSILCQNHVMLHMEDPYAHIVFQKPMVSEYNSHERAYNAFIRTSWTGSTSTSERSTGNRPASKILSWQYGLFCVNSAIMSAALHRKLPWAESKHGRNMQNPPILWKSDPKLNISLYEKVWNNNQTKIKFHWYYARKACLFILLIFREVPVWNVELIIVMQTGSVVCHQQIR